MVLPEVAAAHARLLAETGEAGYGAPVLAGPAARAGRRTLTIAGRTAGVQATLTALPGAFNCSGSPVLSLPVGLVDRLPVAASLVGRIGGDAELLRIGAWVEARAPRTGRPPTSA
jgi:Asp-tRNA(Asn)/Glu-tRNA(Gln) amidotransferase A subunit family amidase